MYEYIRFGKAIKVCVMPLQLILMKNRSFVERWLIKIRFFSLWILSLGCLVVMNAGQSWAAKSYTITQLTDNTFLDRGSLIHDGQVTWSGFPDNKPEIYFYSGGNVTTIPTRTPTNNYFNGYPNDIDNGQIVWAGNDGHTVDIYLYDGTQVKKISVDNLGNNIYPQLHNGQITWESSNEILYHNGYQVIQLTNNGADFLPRIHNGQIAWFGWFGSYGFQPEIFFYDGDKILHLTELDYYGTYPEIDNGQVTWTGVSGNSTDAEIFLYRGTLPPEQITHNNFNDFWPKIHGGQIVWHGWDGNDWEIYFYDGSQPIVQVTDNNLDDVSPKIHNGQIVWHGWDGNDWEIFLDDGTHAPEQLTNNDFFDGGLDIHNGQLTWTGYDGQDYEIFLATPAVKIPLGKTNFPSMAKTEFYRIYVPTRWGGRLTVSTDSGHVELYYPDTQTAVAGPDNNLIYEIPFEDALGNPVDNHGWYYVKHTGSANYTISNEFVQDGESYRPWNFWYYPYAPQGDPAKNLYGVGGALAKYDSLFGASARDQEELSHGSGASWEGHCWGGVVASILLPQPEDTVYGLFSQEEIEGLVTKLADTNAAGEAVIEGIPATDIDNNPLKPMLGADDTDKFVGDFHKGLVKYFRIGVGEERKKMPLQSNLRDSDGIDPNQVWNHAIYKYSSIMEESKEGIEDIVKVTTTIYANDDVFPSDNILDRTETYVYKLRYTSDGEVDATFINQGQDWISTTGFAPYNLYFIEDSQFNNTHNLEVKKENVETLGIIFP
jgi:beta propeller repeat protein